MTITKCNNFTYLQQIILIYVRRENMLNVTYITWYTFRYGRPGTVVALHPLWPRGHEPRPTVIPYPGTVVLPRTLRLSVQHGLLARRHLTLTCTWVQTSTVFIILSNVKVVYHIQTMDCKDKNTIFTSESIINIKWTKWACSVTTIVYHIIRQTKKSN